MSQTKSNQVYVAQTEDWEYTAEIKYKGKWYSATGSSKTSAELHLLRKILFKDANKKAEDYDGK